MPIDRIAQLSLTEVKFCLAVVVTLHIKFCYFVRVHFMSQCWKYSLVVRKSLEDSELYSFVCR